MADGSWSIRPAAAQDGEFLADMLVEAVNWSPDYFLPSASNEQPPLFVSFT
jgi:hypothetical protein